VVSHVAQALGAMPADTIVGHADCGSGRDRFGQKVARYAVTVVFADALPSAAAL